MKRRMGETENGRSREKGKITDSPTCPVGPDLSGSFGVPRFSDSKKVGVTLVELLVAVALLSLLMVAFYTVFKGGSKAYQTGEERVELIQNARIALDMMASQIRQVLPEDGGANPPIEFEIEGGTAKSGPQIRFSAPIDSTAGAEEITFYASNYTVYKKVNNPWAKGSDPGASSASITADLPITETVGVVSYLWFEEKEPVGAAHSGMIRITLAVKADPADTSEKPFSLHTIVKSAFCYGVGLSGEF